MRIKYWFNAQVYILTWDHGLQFDVQRKMRGNRFVGDLWTWDCRRPWRVSRNY